MDTAMNRSFRAPRAWALLCTVAILGLAGSAASYAQDRDRGGEHRGEVLDGRYNHGHYYPRRGAVVRELPGGYRPYYFHGSPFYFSAGVWYAPGPYGFVVTRPPVGLYLSVLPPFYTTVWLGGVPYYYADDVYYQWQPGVNSYEVVTPPAGADQPGAPPNAPPAEDFYIYPKSGQSAEKQAADRYECHDWAKSQTGYDPTQPGGGVPAAANGPQREQYRRAITACLEARDYSAVTPARRASGTGRTCRPPARARAWPSILR